MNEAIQDVAELKHVREVSLLGTADLAFWKEWLKNENLFPSERDGKAQLLIIAADSIAGTPHPDPTAVELRSEWVGRSVLAEPSKEQSLNGFVARRDGLALPWKLLNSIAMHPDPLPIGLGEGKWIATLEQVTKW